MLQDDYIYTDSEAFTNGLYDRVIWRKKYSQLKTRERQIPEHWTDAGTAQMRIYSYYTCRLRSRVASIVRAVFQRKRVSAEGRPIRKPRSSVGARGSRTCLHLFGSGYGPPTFALDHRCRTQQTPWYDLYKPGSIRSRYLLRLFDIKSFIVQCRRKRASLPS